MTPRRWIVVARPISAVAIAGYGEDHTDIIDAALQGGTPPHVVEDTYEATALWVETTLARGARAHWAMTVADRYATEDHPQ